MANRITGRSAFLALLKDEGVTHLFGNPGTTELPVMDALKDHPDMNYVLGLQEALVVAMADGFSRASGKLVACNVHVAPGLGNAMGSLYNAKFTGTPMILTAGQQEIGHGLTEPLLYDPLVPIAEPMVKWAVEVHRLEDLPMIVRRAAKVAMTPPTGPVFISLPGDILNDEAGIDLGASSRVQTRVRPDDATIKALAERIMKAKKPIVIAGDEVVKSDALAIAAEFAEAIGAAAYQQSVGYGSHFLAQTPCYIGSLSRDQKSVRNVLSQYDLMIAIGSDPVRMSVYSETDPKPDDLPVVHIGLNDWDIAKNFAVEMGIKADVAATLETLVPAIRELGGGAYAGEAKARVDELAGRNWTAKREALISKIVGKADVKPIDVDWLALAVAQAIPENGVIVNEGLTSSRHLTDLWPYRERHDYHALASGGIGWGLPASIGVAIAQAPRPVCCFSGDGSAMYSIQSLWTAANMKLPITFVIANNGGYRIIKQRLLAFHGNAQFVGMDFNDPYIDFSMLAQSLGVPAQRIVEPGELRGALEQSFATPGPKLLEVMVDGTV
ncbi:MAG: thiamine pyrophosphate-binding protein [Alphaproteobacteria bacterium]|nr:thiamine pyrophosphate-binding protein [Alphaproteobacteria bacterium]